MKCEKDSRRRMERDRAGFLGVGVGADGRRGFATWRPKLSVDR